MKKVVFKFPTFAMAKRVMDSMITDYMSEFIYASNIGSKVIFMTDFPKRTRIAVNKVVNSIENA